MGRADKLDNPSQLSLTIYLWLGK